MGKPLLALLPLLSLLTLLPGSGLDTMGTDNLVSWVYFDRPRPYIHILKVK